MRDGAHDKDIEMTVQIGIIGGSGLYDMNELTDREERTLVTPFGEPSGPYVIGTLRNKKSRLPGTPWHRPPHHAFRAELSREHFRVQAAWRGTNPLRRAPWAASRRSTQPLEILVPDQFFRSN